MKKKLLTALFASGLLLTACGEDTDSAIDDATTDDDMEDVEAVEDETEEEIGEAEADDDNSIVIGEPMEFDDFIMTVTGYSLGVDYDGKDALIIEYEWENTSDESNSPFIAFNAMGYQDNVQTDDIFMVDGVDLESGQKDIKPGGKIEDGQTAVGIVDMDLPLELEITEMFSFDDNTFSAIIDLSELE